MKMPYSPLVSVIIPAFRAGSTMPASVTGEGQGYDGLPDPGLTSKHDMAPIRHDAPPGPKSHSAGDIVLFGFFGLHRRRITFRNGTR